MFVVDMWWQLVTDCFIVIAREYPGPHDVYLQGSLTVTALLRIKFTQYEKVYFIQAKTLELLFQVNVRYDIPLSETLSILPTTCTDYSQAMHA